MSSVSPRVSVLMPVYNAERFLGEALTSLWRQTYTDFEVIAVDDGSTDASAEMLRTESRERLQLRVVSQAKVGIVGALNHGLEHCRGQFVARMDADDVSTPERLGRQVAFLEMRPDVHACGSWFRVFGSGASELQQLETQDGRIRALLVFRPSFPHPAAMMRRTFFEDGLIYRSEHPHAEDYDLWVRASKTRSFATIPSPLYLYRCHASQVTRVREGVKVESARAIRRALIAEVLARDPSIEELAVHERVTEGMVAASVGELRQAAEWLQSLVEGNAISGRLPHTALREIAAEYWLRACLWSAKLGFGVWQEHRRSPLYAACSVPAAKSARFLLKCVLGPLRKPR